jgi:predicted nucleic acid-binding protein
VKRVLVDLNVVLDVLLDREPHVAASSGLWTAVEEGRVEGLIAAHGFTTIFYLVARHRSRDQARRVIGDLLAVFRVAAEDEPVIRRAAALELSDFEDAACAAAAEAAGCDAVVTRDATGFAASPVPAIDPSLALALLAGEVHKPAAPYGTRRRGRRGPPAKPSGS